MYELSIEVRPPAISDSRETSIKTKFCWLQIWFEAKLLDTLLNDWLGEIFVNIVFR